MGETGTIMMIGAPVGYMCDTLSIHKTTNQSNRRNESTSPPPSRRHQRAADLAAPGNTLNKASEAARPHSSPGKIKCVSPADVIRGTTPPLRSVPSSSTLTTNLRTSRYLFMWTSKRIQAATICYSHNGWAPDGAIVSPLARCCSTFT